MLLLLKIILESASQSWSILTQQCDVLTPFNNITLNYFRNLRSL